MCSEPERTALRRLVRLITAVGGHELLYPTTNFGRKLRASSNLKYQPNVTHALDKLIVS